MFLDNTMRRVKNGYSPQQQAERPETSSNVVHQWGTLWLHLWSLEIEAKYQEYLADQYVIPIAWPSSRHRI